MNNAAWFSKDEGMSEELMMTDQEKIKQLEQICERQNNKIRELEAYKDDFFQKAFCAALTGILTDTKKLSYEMVCKYAIQCAHEAVRQVGELNKCKHVFKSINDESSFNALIVCTKCNEKFDLSGNSGELGKPQCAHGTHQYTYHKIKDGDHISIKCTECGYESKEQARDS